jgi:molybdopterin/thiamine biosynthesis adenylyltransferase
MLSLPPLTDEEKAVYEWQMWVPGFGEESQRKLKGASVLISRVGGVGGMVAYQLAAAGIGKLVLAHAGAVKPSDLNRQLLMTHNWIGRPRLESAARRLHELNPRLAIETVAENVSETNVEKLVRAVDLIVDCAPRFEERFLFNREAIRQRKPMIECAVFELEAQLTTIVPGQTPCLACLYPDQPPAWQRQFPVFGAVAGTIACLGAFEAIKVIAGLGQPLLGQMLLLDMRDMVFRKVALRRNPSCIICAAIGT